MNRSQTAAYRLHRAAAFRREAEDFTYLAGRRSGLARALASHAASVYKAAARHVLTGERPAILDANAPTAYEAEHGHAPRYRRELLDALGLW